MADIIKYFGQAHVAWLLAETPARRIGNARSGAWCANDLEAFRKYTHLLRILRLAA